MFMASIILAIATSDSLLKPSPGAPAVATVEYARAAASSTCVRSMAGIQGDGAERPLYRCRLRQATRSVKLAAPRAQELDDVTSVPVRANPDDGDRSEVHQVAIAVQTDLAVIHVGRFCA